MFDKIQGNHDVMAIPGKSDQHSDILTTINPPTGAFKAFKISLINTLYILFVT